jgi:hypothetical protein
MKSVMHTPEALEPKRALPRSLRLRLILWYGSLIAVALGFFALLFLLLTTDAIDASVNSALRTEARVAMLDVLDDLSVAPPYWPGRLTMQVIDTYRDPGVVVEVLDAQGQVRYLSTNGSRLPLSDETTLPCSLASHLFCMMQWWMVSTCAWKHSLSVRQYMG